MWEVLLYLGGSWGPSPMMEENENPITSVLPGDTAEQTEHLGPQESLAAPQAAREEGHQRRARERQPTPGVDTDGQSPIWSPSPTKR